jgi:hypothetical protein
MRDCWSTSHPVSFLLFTEPRGQIFATRGQFHDYGWSKGMRPKSVEPCSALDPEHTKAGKWG